MTIHHTHTAATRAVVQCVDLIADSPDIEELDLVARLEGIGYSNLHAEKLCAFVPAAFAWALLRKMGLQSFPSHYIAMDQAGTEISIPISTEHYFTAALGLAFETLEHGWTPTISKAKFERVDDRSAEIGAANQLLDAGKTLEEAKLLPLHVLRISAETASEK